MYSTLGIKCPFSAEKWSKNGSPLPSNIFYDQFRIIIRLAMFSDIGMYKCYNKNVTSGLNLTIAGKLFFFHIITSCTATYRHGNDSCNWGKGEGGGGGGGGRGAHNMTYIKIYYLR